MSRKLVPVAVAFVVGVLLSVTRHVVPLLVEFGEIPSPNSLVVFTQLGQFGSFLLVYGLLFGAAYWAGQGMDVREEFPLLAGLTFLTGAFGYFLGMVGLVLVGAATLRGPFVSALLLVGPPIGVGIRLSVVVLAATAVAHFQ
jgi:hypothetical protein